MKLLRLITYRFAFLALIFQGLLSGCIESSASERPLEIRSREILELLKSREFNVVSDRFVLPTSYSPSRRLKEKEKITTFIQILFSQVGEMVEISPSDFEDDLYSLIVTSGDSPDWVKRDLGAKTAIVRHVVDFELLGDVFVDLSFAEFGEGDWGLYSLGLGDTEESSEKTKRLNQIGYEILQRLASESKKP